MSYGIGAKDEYLVSGIGIEGLSRQTMVTPDRLPAWTPSASLAIGRMSADIQATLPLGRLEAGALRLPDGIEP